MSFSVSCWAWKQNCPSSAAKFVLLCLAEHAANDGSRAYPSILLIHKMTHLAERTVRKALAELQERRLVERIERHAASGRCMSTEYRLIIRETTPADLPGSPKPDPIKFAWDDPEPTLADLPGTPPVDLPGGPLQNCQDTLANLQGNPTKNPTNVPEEDTSLRSVARAGARPRAVRTAMPPDWQPGAKGVAFAEERRVDLSTEVEQFRNHHIARANRMADWDAAWRTWCGNDVKFRRPHLPSAANDRDPMQRDPSKLSGAALALWRFNQERAAMDAQAAQAGRVLA